MRQSTDRRVARPVRPAAPAQDFAATRYSIGLSAENPSALAVNQTAGKEAAHA